VQVSAGNNKMNMATCSRWDVPELLYHSSRRTSIDAAGRDALLQIAQLWDLHLQLVAWLSNMYDAFVTYNVLVHHLT
jgi:hypothetical protein